MERLGAVPRGGRGRRRHGLPPARRRRAHRAQDDRAHVGPAARCAAAAGARHAPGLPRRHRPEPGQDHRLPRAASTASSRRGLDAGFMKPVGQRTVIEDGVPADEDAVLMRAVFGLPEPMLGHEPGPHPARLHQGLHRRRGRRGPRRADPGRPRDVRSGPRRAPHRGHGPRRRRRGHRAVERGRRGDARRAGDHRQRGRRRPADRRDRAQRRALRASRRAGRRRDRQQGRRRRRSPGIGRGPRARPRACTASRCSACCRTGRSCPTRRSA